MISYDRIAVAMGIDINDYLEVGEFRLFSLSMVGPIEDEPDDPWVQSLESGLRFGDTVCSVSFDTCQQRDTIFSDPEGSVLPIEPFSGEDSDAAGFLAHVYGDRLLAYIDEAEEHARLLVELPRLSGAGVDAAPFDDSGEAVTGMSDDRLAHCLAARIADVYYLRVCGYEEPGHESDAFAESLDGFLAAYAEAVRRGAGVDIDDEPDPFSPTLIAHADSFMAEQGWTYCYLSDRWHPSRFLPDCPTEGPCIGNAPCYASRQDRFLANDLKGYCESALHPNAAALFRKAEEERRGLRADRELHIAEELERHRAEMRDIYDSRPAWVWSLVGNIIDEHPYGEEKTIVRGTKHFRPGTKVYVLQSGWDDLHESLPVIGRSRDGRLIEIVMRSKLIENFRLKKVYSPTIIEMMYRSYVSEPEEGRVWFGGWGDSDEDRRSIVSRAAWLNLTDNQKKNFYTLYGPDKVAFSFSCPALPEISFSATIEKDSDTGNGHPVRFEDALGQVHDYGYCYIGDERPKAIWRGTYLDEATGEAKDLGVIFPDEEETAAEDGEVGDALDIFDGMRDCGVHAWSGEYIGPDRTADYTWSLDVEKGDSAFGSRGRNAGPEELYDLVRLFQLAGFPIADDVLRVIGSSDDDSRGFPSR